MSGDRAPPSSGLLDRLARWLLALPPVRWLKPILDDYAAAGGGLLASGLAFNSLFAILPAILLTIAIIGIFLGEPERLAALVATLSAAFPPLAGFFEEALAGFAEGAVSFSIIGLLGLVWGSSRFYQSLDDAFARIFEGSPRRDPIERGILGVLSVVILIGAAVGAIALVNLADRLVAGGIPGVEFALGVVTTTLGSWLGDVVLFGVGIGLIYRMVPTARPSWRSISLPALAVGAALGVFTAVFALLTPRFVGSLQVYGAFVVVFAAMIWLSIVAQAILVGAAWVHRRAVGVSGAPQA